MQMAQNIESCILQQQILMNITSATLSQGCIKQLYTTNRSEIKYPTVQILDFEESELNDKEIIIRISDGQHFIDCTLSGNYILSNGSIVQTKNAATVTTFKKYGIIRMDFFSKIDDTRICKLKIMIRKMTELNAFHQLIGLPQEIQQFMVNKKLSKDHYQNTVKKSKEDRQADYHHTIKPDSHHNIKVQNYMEIEGPVSHQPIVAKNYKKQSSPEHNNNGHSMNQTLTLHQILAGKQGFLIGRLIRLKNTRKQTKDGPMTVCYLGLVNKYNELVRVHLAGRIAMNNQKLLKKNKSYYIRGFDIVNLKNTGAQIRLKDKEYKIIQIHNQDLTKALPADYYNWDHQLQNETVQHEFVDVIGLIDDIEEKATYTNNQTRSVIRMVLKNKFKSIRISFWTDQIKNFQGFNLKKKEFIIIQDIRKKQGKYYDFSSESNLIPVKQFPFLHQKFKNLFPEMTEEISPQNIKQLQKLYTDEPSNTKLQTIKAYLSGFKDNKLIYHLCDECKRKVEKSVGECQCGSDNLICKYNFALQFSDNTGSIVVMSFDAPAQKLIGKTAAEVNNLSEEELQHIFQSLVFKYYLISVENRNQRLILRNIQVIDQDEQVGHMRQNLAKINNNDLKQIW